MIRSTNVGQGFRLVIASREVLCTLVHLMRLPMLKFFRWSCRINRSSQPHLCEWGDRNGQYTGRLRVLNARYSGTQSKHLTACDTTHAAFMHTPCRARNILPFQVESVLCTVPFLCQRVCCFQNSCSFGILLAGYLYGATRVINLEAISTRCIIQEALFPCGLGDTY